MPETIEEKKGGLAARFGKLVAFGLVGLIAAGAFAGMGLFMFNMGRDMSAMTTSVMQMGRDVTSMATDMQAMSADMRVMAGSMVEGQAVMSQDFARVRVGMEQMTGDMAGMAKDMGALSINIGTMTGSIDTMNLLNLCLKLVYLTHLGPQITCFLPRMRQQISITSFCKKYGNRFNT